MKKILNYYLDTSEKLWLLDFVMGIMQIMNTPIKLLWLVVPVGVFGLGMHYRDRVTIPLVPESVTPYIDKAVFYLLWIVLFGGIILTIYMHGTALRNKETEIFKKALKGTDEDVDVIKLIYKKKTNGIIERRIFSNTVASVWNNKQVYPYILKMFDEHFWKEQFKEDPDNSRITIIKTKEKYTIPQKEYIDRDLERDMGEAS